jgi:type I restriction enzyme S subunit
MSKQWPITRLAEVLSERRETPSSDDLEQGRVRIVSKISFDTGAIDLRFESQTKTGMILARPGDLVISGINAAKGAVAIYDAKNKEPLAATIHYGAYTPDPNRADLKFLWWFFRSQFFRYLLSVHVPDGIKTELKAKRLLQIPIPLPPLEEQRRIVVRIEELTSQIHEARSLRRLAIEEADSLSYASLRNARHRLLNSPHPQFRLGTLTKVTSGGTPSRSNATYWDGNIPWIKTGELLDRDIARAEEHITQAGVENSSATLFPPGTVLIALYGQGQTRGRTGRLLISAATNQACCAVLPEPEKFEPRFIQYWLRSLYIELREESQGGAQPNWNSGTIKDLIVALPPLSEQRRIVAELDALQSEMNSLRRLQAETAAELDALLPSVLSKAFAGEL